MSRCQSGLKKGQRGVLPSSYPLKQMGKVLEDACLKYMAPTISEDGLSWVCDPKKAITSFLVHFRYHVIGTKKKPMLVALTGDGLVIYGGTQSCFCGGLKHVDPRLPSQQQAKKYHWFQSKTEYTPLVVCFATEAECLIHMRALDQELLRIEREETLDADQALVLGIDCTDVYIQVVKPEDMSFAWKETGRGGACKCPNAPFFCHLCCAISKRPSMGRPGPTCPFPELDCKGTCHHMKIATPESMGVLVEREEELTDLLDHDLSWAYPCCANAADYKRACAERGIKYKNIPQAQGECLMRAQTGVVLDKLGKPEPYSVRKAPIESVRKGLQLRGVTEDSTREPKEQLEEILLQEEEHTELKALLGHPTFKDINPEELLTDDCLRLI